MEKRQAQALTNFGINPDQLVHKDGRYWMTAEQLGMALGYREPRKGVMKVFGRHRKDIEPFIGVVKLTTPSSPDGRGGGVQEVTVFDTDAQYRIAMLANTPKSEKFRTFIVNMLKALERQEFIHISQVMQWKKELIELQIMRHLEKSRIMDMKKYKRLLHYRKLGLSQRETAKLLDISRRTVQDYETIPRRYELTALKGGAA